jgi:hypothetical protein
VWCALFAVRFALTPTELQKNPVDGFSAGLVDDDNILEWQIVIMGWVAGFGCCSGQDLLAWRTPI